MIWFQLQDGQSLCPFRSGQVEDRDCCAGSCPFFVQFKGNLEKSDGEPEFDCLFRLVLLKYLGVRMEGL